MKSTANIFLSDAVIHSENLSKSFGELTILSEINFTLRPQESVALLGSSGSGKSSLLHILGGLDRPSSGTVYWLGHDILKIRPSACDRLRNQHIGFVYQFHHLLAEFSALENVLMPLKIRGIMESKKIESAQILLTRLGLKSRMSQRPPQLSGGERQRVALARALITEPACLLADEPTGNLDNDNAEQVMELLLSLCQEKGMALLLATHDLSLAQKTEKKYFLKKGHLNNVNT
jgi:lipoprotein-releasing system ATP-binding protein